MQVILKQDVKGLGFKHDVVKVRNGYGLNFLIPQGLAVVASRDLDQCSIGNLRFWLRARPQHVVGVFPRHHVSLDDLHSGLVLLDTGRLRTKHRARSCTSLGKQDSAVQPHAGFRHDLS